MGKMRRLNGQEQRIKKKKKTTIKHSKAKTNWEAKKIDIARFVRNGGSGKN
jgi:hypothetical protein